MVAPALVLVVRAPMVIEFPKYLALAPALWVMLPELMDSPVLVEDAGAVSPGVAIARPVRLTPAAVTFVFRSRLMPVIVLPAVNVRAVPLVLTLRPV